jgi:hypothetical protein
MTKANEKKKKKTRKSFRHNSLASKVLNDKNMRVAFAQTRV